MQTVCLQPQDVLLFLCHKYHHKYRLSCSSSFFGLKHILPYQVQHKIYHITWSLKEQEKIKYAMGAVKGGIIERNDMKQFKHPPTQIKGESQTVQGTSGNFCQGWPRQQIALLSLWQVTNHRTWMIMWMGERLEVSRKTNGNFFATVVTRSLSKETYFWLDSYAIQHLVCSVSVIIKNTLYTYS